MRHSGNYAQTVSDRYELGAVSTKIYIYDELDRFVTVATLKLSSRDLQYFLDGIAKAKDKFNQDMQPTLPPWD